MEFITFHLCHTFKQNQDGTQWKLNPLSTLQFGRNGKKTKSVKFHLKHIVGDTYLTYEELTLY